MNSALKLMLQADAGQAERLVELQKVFAQACNHLAPLVQRTRCWNRVALHHMAYKNLREHFPTLGSQMACNAIYSVSRASRWVYQHPASPFNLTRLGTAELPLLRFAATAPVYFDRHTLSLRAGEISMYTLDGRMRFQAGLTPQQEARFRAARLREIALTRVGGQFMLSFSFADATAAAPAATADAPNTANADAEANANTNATDAAAAAAEDAAQWPEYLLVDQQLPAAKPALALPACAPDPSPARKSPPPMARTAP